MISDWDNETFVKELIEAYQGMNPTPESNASILADLGVAYDVSPNSIRVFLTKKGVYVKAEAVAAEAAVPATGSKRVPKEATINKLKELIAKKEKPVDDAILDKLTGKAAQYFIGILS